LSWMERVIRRRRETPELGWGATTVIATSERAVLAHRADWEASTVLAVHNLGNEPCVVTVDVACEPGSRLVDLLDHEVGAPAVDGNDLELRLEAYGYRWFRVHGANARVTP
ncbi:MAG: alpha-glucosidase C-terminal domain-containing protein, partial [Acidimicrobiia bacterium]|nr:alpha-glucosidase C-terminal domain-containing protein [Acidimicrobiia bacterium]